MSRKKSLPVEPVDIELDSMAHDGRAVGRIDGKAVFVDGGLPGERVRFQYTARRRQYDEGRLVEVLQSSADRVEAKCPHFGICGGCRLQHMRPGAQIATKQALLQENLQRIANVQAQHWLEPLQADIGIIESKPVSGCVT